MKVLHLITSLNKWCRKPSFVFSKRSIKKKTKNFCDLFEEGDIGKLFFIIGNWVIKIE